jgi:general secretion pathway protein L
LPDFFSALTRFVMRTFLRWWLEQLADLAPRRLVALLHRPPDAVLIEQDEAGGSLAVRRRGQVGALGRLAAGSASDGDAVLPQRNRLPPLILLRPAAAAILRKRVRLPEAASGNLKQLLAYEIERETPFSAAELYWDYRLRRHEAGEGHLEIELILVPRDRVATLTASAAAAGLEPIALEIAGDDGSLQRIGLADDAARSPRDRSLLVLAGAAAALVVLAIAAPLLRQSLAIGAAEAAFDAAKGEAAAAAKLRQEYDQLVNTADFMATERARVGSPLQALAAATRLFPDDTYLTAFSLDGNHLAMTGFSQDAASLIARLAAASELRDPAFTGPVTRAAGSNLEAFAIGVTLASSAAP